MGNLQFLAAPTFFPALSSFQRSLDIMHDLIDWTNWSLDQNNWSPNHRTPSCDSAQIFNDHNHTQLISSNQCNIS